MNSLLMTSMGKVIESRCTWLAGDSPQRLVFVERATGFQMFIRSLLIVFYTLFYLLLLPGNLFFSWKFLSLYGTIELNCTPITGTETQNFTNAPANSSYTGFTPLSCTVAQSGLGGLISQRKTVIIPKADF
ncbi:MAG: hypothetical protein ACRC6M_11585, partial [Microcystaceae cyanobacterium]